MATSEGLPGSQSIGFGSNETALCLIPPQDYWSPIDRLRTLYDRAYEKWPPHVNLVYPFVKAENLQEATNLISRGLEVRASKDLSTPLSIALETAGVFLHRHNNTIFLHDNDTNRTARLKLLRKAILDSLGQNVDEYNMHMTIGQSTDLDSDAHKFLVQKANLVPTMAWHVKELCILVREKSHINGQTSSHMRLWGTISLDDFKIHALPTPSQFYEVERVQANTRFDDVDYSYAVPATQKRVPFQYSTESSSWMQRRSALAKERGQCPETLNIASYNVLAEFEYPPSQERYPLILSNLLHDSAMSDILILEEVTDDFLCFLLADGHIRQEYPFVTNAPPDQADIEPLPSHINVVVLSKWCFSWEWVPCKRRHKGSLVLQFDDIGRLDPDNDFVPLILATVHLTCGLMDGSVAAKRSELQSILRHLADTYAKNPWILAGDFNITTSAATISAALEKKSISPQTAEYLTDIEGILLEAGLSDTWTAARLGNLDATDLHLSQKDIYDAVEGEQGATFDPLANELAAKIVGSGFNNRPQRYDRILFKAAQLLSIGGFNMFGRVKEEIQRTNSEETKTVPTYASDHWGVRCSLRLTSESSRDSFQNETPNVTIKLTAKTVPHNLADANELKSSLVALDVFPSEEEFANREAALQLLRDTLEDTDSTTETSQSRTGVQFVVVPVGSYGLGVWTASSDVDCLCLGSISSKTFFALATQRLRRAAPRGVKVLRRVNAQSGTMLELEVLGVKMDLQYAASALIAQTWPRAVEMTPPLSAASSSSSSSSSSSPNVFRLPAQTLAKLKPARDLWYVRRTVPDLAAFRAAFYLVKTWARQRGIYAARFGYLGGIHIAVLLARVCKLLSRDHGASAASSVPAILVSFFHHYANFDWKRDMVFDPFFHNARLRYVRTSREAMVILGYHSPSLNVATAASLPSVKTIAEEFQRADRILSTPGVSWSEFTGSNAAPAGDDNSSSSGVDTFLRAYKSYVKIDVQFWGVSLAKGSRFVGWLESRCVMLLVDIGRRLPNIHARMWPARFVAADDNASPSDEKDSSSPDYYQGCYLVGLDRLEEQDMSDKEELRLARGSLVSAAQKFTDQVRADERYYDAACSWMTAAVVRRSDLGDLELDHRSWGEYTIGDDEEEEEDEEEEDDDDDEQDEDDDLTNEEAHAETSSKKSKRTDKNKKKVVAVPTYTGKFRSSADVISRIRWDPGMDSGDYLVGYEDRFLGIKERALDQWKAEQTDEEFIPQHRIMYFKRVSDGVVVWDRRSRRDHVFGSGVRDES